MNPYYNLDEHTKTTIMELIKTCEAVQLGNVQFEYQELTIRTYFALAKRGSHWGLAVYRDNKRDVYEVTDKIGYKYSE